MSKRIKSELTKSPSLTLSREKYRDLMCDGLFGLDAIFTSWKFSYHSEEDEDMCWIHLKDCVLRRTIDNTKGLSEGRKFNVDISLGDGEIIFRDAYHRYSTTEHITDPVYVKYNFRCYPDGFLESQGHIKPEDENTE